MREVTETEIPEREVNEGAELVEGKAQPSTELAEDPSRLIFLAGAASQASRK